ncbi:MAG: hypothetical protein HY537_18460 [Deltaproteobacteria bacterium]|nr:hypothetical protein [Deltaproteobacteria bacterium]
MRGTFICAMFCLLPQLFPVVFAAADPILVVANPSLKTQLNKEDLKEIFLGNKTMVDSRRVIPVDQARTSKLRKEFYQFLVGKSPVEMNVYWAEQIFSGKARIPSVVPDDQAVIQYVSSNSDAIGYVSRSADTKNVTVLMLLQ